MSPEPVTSVAAKSAGAFYMPSKLDPKLQAQWEQILADEGLRPLDGVDGNGRWTFSGGMDPAPGEKNRHAAHRSLTAFGADGIAGSLHKQQTTWGAEEDGDPTYISDTPDAEFWRIVGHYANTLPRRYLHRKLLVEVAERGTLAPVVKKFGLSKRKGEWVWRKFLVDVCHLPPPKTTVPGRTRASNEEPKEHPPIDRKRLLAQLTPEQRKKYDEYVSAHCARMASLTRASG